MTFQPGRTTSSLAGAVVIKPAQSRVPVRPWAGATVRRITSVAATDIKVQLDGVPVAKPATGLMRAPVTKAGGAR